MQSSSGRFLPSLVVALVAAAVAFGLYWGGTERRFDAHDLETIDISAEAGRSMYAERIWRTPLPYQRPDLGLYRPIHGLALKIQYGLWPSNAVSFRKASVVTFAVLLIAFALVAGRWLGAERGAGAWATAAAGLVFALHPMATESVNWASAQNALIAALAWVLALGIYQLALDRRLHFALASPAIGLCYFAAFGAYEPAILLPLALCALDRLGPRPETEPLMEPEPPESEKGADAKQAELPAPRRRIVDSALGRLLVYGIPLALVAIALAAMRRISLDGRLGPAESLYSLFEAGLPERLAAGASLFTLGFTRLIFPIGPTLFYIPLYEPELIWPVWIGLPVAGALGLAVFFLRRVSRPLALGLALALIPLLATFQFVPLSAAFSERLLLLSLPGFALMCGAVAQKILSLPFTLKSSARGAGVGIAVIAAAVILLAPITIGRNRLWRDQAELWTSEMIEHPTLPHPVTYHLIQLVSRGVDFDVAALEAKAEQAISLAEPPDADLAYSYLALLHFQRRQPADLEPAVERAIAAPGPHMAGYYSTLGMTAFRLNMLDLAKRTLEKELERDAGDFESNYALAQIHGAQKEWEQALFHSRRATVRPPRHIASSVFLQRGRLAAKTDAIDEAFLSYEKAIDLEPAQTDPYAELAQMLMENEDYARAEQVLVRARQNANVTSFAALFAIHAEGLERQGKMTEVFFFLRQMSDLYTRDYQLQLYCARYFLDHKRPEDASRIYLRVLNQLPNHPDALVGMGLYYLRAEDDPNKAAQMWQLALRSDPNHADARRLLTDLRQHLEGRGLLPDPSEAEVRP